MVKKRLEMFETLKEHGVFLRPRVLHDSYTVKLNLLRGHIFTSAVSTREILHNFRFNDETKSSVQSIVKSIINYLYISLVFNVFELVSW